MKLYIEKGVIIITLKVSALASGSSGNSIYIESEEKKILIDAGLSGKAINRRLEKIDRQVEDIDLILVTHEHNDHVHGVGVLARKCDIPIYATAGTWAKAEEKIGNIKGSQQKEIKQKEFTLGDCKIRPFAISHDAQEPVGYRIKSSSAQIAVATDTGEITPEVQEHVKGSDLVVLESNHDLEMLKIGPYPWHLKKRIMGEEGHLSNDDAAAFAVELAQNSVQRILLAHLSQDNNVPELAFLTIKNMLIEADIELGTDLELSFAHQDEVSPLFTIE
ncbi:MBL fold metallo-hydrolase [Halanaerobacter jeridensis]|uniref:MBL fold metallo-hydrolase n=1 Tax=Halanaerobacter jeridensis TaxID=706427 RepID=UPI00308416DB